MLIFSILAILVERSFSKFKLIKSYLKSTMFQQRLDELDLSFIEKYTLNEISFDKLINNYVL